MSASWWEPLADDPPERAFFEQWLADCQTSAEGEGMVRDWEEVSPAGALGPYVSEDTKEWIRERRTLAVQLRIVRQGLGLTQGAAAKLLGVKVANYRANEQGGGNIRSMRCRLKQLARFQEVLSHRGMDWDRTTGWRPVQGKG